VVVAVLGLGMEEDEWRRDEWRTQVMGVTDEDENECEGDGAI
jgi:hypothetical protein